MSPKVLTVDGIAIQFRGFKEWKGIYSLDGLINWSTGEQWRKQGIEINDSIFNIW